MLNESRSFYPLPLALLMPQWFLPRAEAKVTKSQLLFLAYRGRVVVIFLLQVNERVLYCTVTMS